MPKRSLPQARLTAASPRARLRAGIAAWLLTAGAGAVVGCGAADFEPAAEGPRSGEACAVQGMAAVCGMSEGAPARIFCDAMSAPDDLQWGPCLTQAEIECSPGATRECDGGEGMMRCELFGGQPAWSDEQCDFSGGGEASTPLVLQFDDAPVQLVPMGVDGFDIDGLGRCDAFDWPTPQTPWLSLDRDMSGGIETGAELFGSGTRLLSGRRASNGFEALAELDSDGDGAITPDDARWAEIRTWADHDGDRMGSGYELGGLDDAGLVRIELSYRVDRVCDARGNCEVERASFVYRDRDGEMRTGEVVDLHLACQ